MITNLKWDVKEGNLYLSKYCLLTACIRYNQNASSVQISSIMKMFSCCNHGPIEVSVSSCKVSKRVSYAPKRINLYEYCCHWWRVYEFQKKETIFFCSRHILVVLFRPCLYMRKMIFMILTFIYKCIHIYVKLLYFSIVHIPSIFTYSKNCIIEFL